MTLLEFTKTNDYPTDPTTLARVGVVVAATYRLVYGTSPQKGMNCQRGIPMRIAIYPPDFAPLIENCFKTHLKEGKGT
ncbi:hypothetical protein SAMN05421823_11542 [Catalinimonas alkaloidigena]|uniref:Uncharacterized protein n=1 Tax=Catalinimonas alkaloidigena TaxID=1075417 RepID=A0A1G9TZG6_9BACT|nr:hypothetical protein SAMN05421823_11542 [Catalinimonas alkaloidigena]